MTKSIFSSKTVWVAIIQGVLGVVMAVSLQHPELGYLLILKSVLDIILRAITNQPVA